jgi:hypothetical protein
LAWVTIAKPNTSGLPDILTPDEIKWRPRPCGDKG